MEHEIIAPLKAKRSRLEIYADILTATKAEMQSSGDGAIVTRVQYQTRTPYMRFRRYLDIMQGLNLVQLLNGKITITSAGEELLLDYGRIRNLLRRTR